MIIRSELPVYPIETERPELERVRVGNSGVDYVHTLVAEKAGPNAMLTALTHGNEYSGAVALMALMDSGLRPCCGSWTIAFANIAAFHSFNPSAPDASRFVDVDMNRVWSEERLGGAVVHQEVSRAKALLPFVRRADYLLDLHSMHEACEPLLLSGPTEKGLQFAKKLGFPRVIVRDAGHADGKRMMDFESFGRPDEQQVALLVEAGQHWSKSALDASMATLYRFLLATGTVDPSTIPDQCPVSKPQIEVVVEGRCVATTHDVAFERDWKGMEHIPEAGTVIAYDAGRVVTTPFDDCILVMPSLRQILPGVTYLRFGRLASKG